MGRENGSDLPELRSSMDFLIKTILAFIVLIGLMVLAARLLLRQRPQDSMSDAELMDRHSKGADTDDD